MGDCNVKVVVRVYKHNGSRNIRHNIQGVKFVFEQVINRFCERNLSMRDYTNGGDILKAIGIS